MGGSSIAAIVLILIAILISLASIFWLKRNERLCFKPYQEVESRDLHVNIEDNTNGRLSYACTMYSVQCTYWGGGGQSLAPAATYGR
jgi:hypothetical protein